MIDYELFQIGYVTRDVDAAIAGFTARGVAGDFAIYEPTFEVRTPRASGTATMRQGIGWSAGIMYEVIQPVAGLCDIYTDVLPADDAVRFHHVAYLADDWDGLKARIAAEARPIAFEGGDDQRRFVYLDTRDTVGHYLEYVWLPPDKLAGIRAMRG